MFADVFGFILTLNELKENLPSFATASDPSIKAFEPKSYPDSNTILAIA